MIALRRTPVTAPELEGLDCFKVVPFRRPELAYAVFLPRHFEADTTLEPAEVGPLEILPIGRFRGDGLELEVGVFGTPYELGLVDLARILADREHLALESADLASFHGREGLDLTALEPVSAPGAPILRTRFILVRQGSRVVRVRVRADAEALAAASEDVARMLSLFRFRAQGDHALIEPHTYIASTGAHPLGFLCGRSFTAREAKGTPYGRQSLDAFRRHAGEVLTAIRVEAFDGDAFGDLGPDRLLGEVLQGLTAVGFSPNRLKQRFRGALPGQPSAATERGEVHEGRAFGQGAEARIALRLGAHVSYAVATIGPPRATDLWGHLVARRAHEIAYLSLGDREVDFGLTEESLAVLRPATYVEPIYRVDGELDERTFDDFGLDEAAVDDEERAKDGHGARAAEQAEPEDRAPLAEEDAFAALEATLPADATLADIDPEILDDLRTELLALDEE